MGIKMYHFTDDCLIGVEEIDNEHRELFRIINETQELLENQILNDKYDRIREMVERLGNYAEEHFRHEEEYMARIRHPELELQKRQHLFFCDKINGITNSFTSDNEQQAVLEDLLKYLVTWLYRHIISSDLMIGKLKHADEINGAPVFTEEYLTGIALIDKEHKELFRIIGDVHHVIEDEFITDKYDEIIRLLEELKDYTKFHFQDEELYMEKIHYSGLEAQKRAHDAFVARLEEMDLEHIDTHQQETLEEIMEFLTEWLVNHILNSDKKIGM
ncbi:MAG: hemerythrin family protein [Bacillus sp. (in: Bacteria)]|nr:hemerythrin family protein [Bacillus sp. (in: firmicutes)]MCM1426727.1 hemerythrin family protein [Eubacterium sp.]